MTTNAVWAENTVEGRMDCSYTSQSQALKGIYAFKVEDLPIEYCTHIIYSHISFEESSMTIIPSNPEYDVGYNGWDKFIDLKKVNPNLKLLMRVERAADFIETAENRKDLIDAIVSFLTQHKFDGVTIPWLSSWMDGPEVDGLYEFFEELRRSFETAGHPTWEANLIVPIDDNSINSERICK
ncbi:AGAP001863-PB-like protein [Anopheles sinensis]|uniref:AGAP001863-PB-like protein n=1 Tax=Anopheles sinensis TaxID=74873 RepID=A0A084VRS4_ANOSI|nr:AGAP001863-PB-like protein [Anopheles sinensis]